MRVSIRMRLTLAYCLVLTLTLGLLGSGLYFVMARSVYAGVDGDLTSRFEGVARLMKRQIPRMSGEELREEFREHSGLRPGGDMLEVWDEQGKIVFESASIREYSVAKPSRTATAAFSNLTVSDRPLRVLAATLAVDDQEYSVLLATPVRQTQDMVTHFGWLLLGSIPAVLLLAALGGYWMSRHALAPVDEITNAARTISVQNMSQRLTAPNTGDELQRLSETLNEMMSRLQASFQKITQFTADASHELRTPIALIRTTAELALRRRRDEGEYREALDHILHEAECTTSLIENLLLLARADSGTEALEIAPADLTAIVDQTCRHGTRLAAEKNVALHWGVPPYELVVDADVNAIRRLLLILIDNAVKYTPESGQIEVHLDSDQVSATITVRDSGFGIARDDLPHIFERFYRADKARTRDIGGTGLGLSIAQWIAEKHQTTIRVDSAPERGSTFTLTLPLSAPTTQAWQTAAQDAKDD